jgi:alkylation response protein AidB-like acyl-CoA dehydrogenase
MRRYLFDASHEMFRDSIRQFIAREMLPNIERWDEAGQVDRALYAKAGAAGLLGQAAPVRLGGAGERDFRWNAVLIEELAAAGLLGSGGGLTLQNDIVIPYLLELASAEQQERWLPGVCTGETVTAIAMTEPGGGSDLAAMRTTAERRGDSYVINGAKTFISNGLISDLIVVACKTDPSQRRSGMSLIVVEAGTPGFERGRKLRKVGQHAQDTAELFFRDAVIPAANLLGEPGRGFEYLTRMLPQERLSIAVTGVAHARRCLKITLDYVMQREAFGQPIGTFQHTRFALAELATEIEIAQSFVDAQVMALNAGELTPADAAMAKWWTTELAKRAADLGVQLHGGYGYMQEYPISQAWLDARVMTLYGGTTEIMKEIVGRSLGLRARRASSDG